MADVSFPMKLLKSLSDFLTCLVPPTFIMLIVYSMLSLMHFEDNTQHCEIKSWADMDGLDVNAISIIFIVTMVVYAILIRFDQLTKDIGDSDNTQSRGVVVLKAFLALCSFGLTITLVMMSQLALYSSYCAHPVSEETDSTSSNTLAEVSDINGKIESVEYTAIAALFLLIVFALYDFVDVVNHTDGPKLLDQGVMRFSTFIIRFSFSTVLFVMYMQGNDDFNSMKSTQVNSTQCLEQLCNMSTSSTLYENYARIELAEVKINDTTKSCITNAEREDGDISIEANPTMEVLAYFVFIAGLTEFVMMIFVQVFDRSKFENEAVFEVMKWSTRLVSLTVNIMLSLFVFSLIMAQDVAACPLLDYEHSDVHNVQIMASLYLSVQFLVIVIKEFLIPNVDWDKKGLWLGLTEGYMYSHLTKNFM